MYVVRCDDGTLYTGVTTDITRRVNEHNASPRGAKYTKSRRPVTLVYSKAYPNRSLAMKAEYRFKQLTRAEKVNLVVDF
jgi:putative endonuclease